MENPISVLVLQNNRGFYEAEGKFILRFLVWIIIIIFGRIRIFGIEDILIID